ncbi:LysM repeat protein [Salirhabdus euzebyi]|uniref:LysM repeat protein n=1 Tax=Salirhabdus euzebyi TaxID=394506 RepID=A0A841Q9J7_9BACI|nr:LysM peptidoglycan-binding domain-containing protein [Salirhabdus euzebyi]MBB6455080.1 LysM repeat protein [Salirhabdus euzebyi]
MFPNNKRTEQNHLEVTNHSSHENEFDTYTVNAGDTLIAIATLHGTSMDAIKNENGLTSTHIHAGQVLKIPDNLE